MFCESCSSLEGSRWVVFVEESPSYLPQGRNILRKIRLTIFKRIVIIYSISIKPLQFIHNQSKKHLSYKSLQKNTTQKKPHK